MTQPSTMSALSPAEDFWAFDSPAVFDSLEGKRSYLLSGRNGQQARLSGSAYLLLKSARAGVPFSELVHTLNAREGEKKVSEDELRAKYEALVADLRALEMQAGERKAPWGFWLRFRLVREEYVVKVASMASHLYHPIIVGCTLAALVIGVIVAFHRGFNFMFPPGAVLPGFVWFLLVLLAHEFGHASACARFGARPSDIGFTFYLVYPAFYSDVSSAWRLSRGQRVVVDLGGCYFQAMVTLAFLVLFYRTGWQSVHVAIILSLYGALSSLNPIFKFDGYWVVADMLGVCNLSRQPLRIGNHLLKKLLGYPTQPLPWPRSVTAILIAYSGLAITVWSYFALQLFPMLQSQLIAARQSVVTIGTRLGTGALPRWAETSTLLFSCMLLVLVAITLWNLVSTLSRGAVRGMKSLLQRLRGDEHGTSLANSAKGSGNDPGFGQPAQAGTFHPE